MMMARQKLLAWGLVLGAVWAAPGAARAVVLELGDDADVWMRQSDAGTAYQTDGLWVSNSDAYDGGQERRAMLQFDLSTVGEAITSAYIEIYNQGSQAVTLAPGAWVDSSIQPAGLGNLTWADYELFVQPFETSFEQFGGGDFAAGTPSAGTYGTLGVASAADVAVLENIRANGDGIISVTLSAVSGGREYGDAGFYTQPVRLVINELPPVDGDLDGDFDVDLDDYGVLTDPANWLQATAGSGEGADLTGDAFVDLADFAQFKIFYHDFNGSAFAVPEPASAALAATALLAGLALMRRRQA